MISLGLPDMLDALASHGILSRLLSLILGHDIPSIVKKNNIIVRV
jgi:hypothetical protein